MRNGEAWTASKFVVRDGRLAASSDPAQVAVASRLMATLVARTYQAALAAHASGRLLDLGCGKAPLYATYKPLVTDVTCVDWANSLHGGAHLDLEADLSQPLPLDDAAFDTVILSDVLEHIPVPSELCGEIARVLAPGGKLVMNVPFFYWLHEQPHDFYRYTEFALRRFMDLAGLRVVSLDPVGGALEIVADVLSKAAMRGPRLARFAAAGIQRASLRFAATRLGAKAMARTAAEFPLGYFMVAEKPRA